MKRSFNYTNRYRMDGEWFDFSVHEQISGPSKLRYHIKQVDERFTGCRCWLEIYRGANIMRKDCGIFTAPITGEYELSEFDRGEPVLLRIKMVREEDKKRLICGWRDEIRPASHDAQGREKKSLLPVGFKDLGDLVWKTELEVLPPTLWINNKTGINEEYIKSDPVFAALVFPQVLREILLKYLGENDDDDEQNEWIEFAVKLVGKPYEKAKDEDTNERMRADWVEEVVQNFSKGNHFLERFIKREGA